MEISSNQRLPAILRSIIVVFVLLIMLVVGLLVKSIFFSEKVETPRTATERSLMDAQAVVKADPKNAQARLEVGRVLAEMGQYEEASQQLKIAKQLDPKEREIPYTLAMVYKANGNAEAAIKELNAAIALHEAQFTTKFADAYFELGLIYYDQENYKKALGAFENAEKGSPQAADMLLYLGLTYEKLGKKDKAVAVLEYVVKLLPDNKEAKEALVRLGTKPK